MLAVAALAGCAISGHPFNASGLNQIIVGRTTLDQATRYLGAAPVDTWRRDDGSVLARWAYKSSAVTDAVYFRREVWLRFGPDGAFQYLENTVNIPSINYPRTQEEVARQAAEVTARTPQAAPASTAAPPPGQQAVTFPIVSTPQIQEIEAPVSANPAADSTTSDTSGNPLPPSGAVYRQESAIR
jgi:hypothetical protein